MKIFPIILSMLACLCHQATAQSSFTRHDTLRGSITPQRAWWDLTHYYLSVKVDPADKTFSGSNVITYRVLQPSTVLQIDLQSPMKIAAVTQEGKPLKVRQDSNAWFITLKKKQVVNSINSITVTYSGRPRVSTMPPWHGGITWAKDKNNNDLVVTTCQGDGASLWWPCKDHMYDEPDSMTMALTVPGHLTGVANGRLRSTMGNADGTRTFEWVVANPINNYGVNVNVGDYIHFGEKYAGEKGVLDCDYYVLSYNLKKATTQFKEVPRMLEAFEHWFGPYPFYEDSYKLVEVPYPGMEHQSSVTYGNAFRNGYHGTDLSHTGWGYNFDFIIIHESGHEWFANNITYRDIADMWIHESFTSYSEGLFLDYFYGKEAGAEYLIGTRKNILNNKPVIGHYDVNMEGSGDMYPKGANMLHTLRQLVGDDNKWRMILRGLNETFYHQTVTSEQIETFLAEKTGLVLRPFFDQYLRDKRIPRLEHKATGNQLSYRWANCVPGLAIPVEVTINNGPHTLHPTTDWKSMDLQEPLNTLDIDEDYYVESAWLK